MKAFRIAFLLLILILSFTHFYGVSASNQEAQEEKINLYAVARLRDYWTDVPISNMSITATISTAWGGTRIGPVFTNETGIIQVFLDNVVNLTSPEPPRLLELELPNNYTLIRVNDSFMEDIQYEAEYVPNRTRYTEMEIILFQKNLENQTLIEINLWVLGGKLIKVFDRDPVTGKRMSLSMKPAVKAVMEEEKEISAYESYYFSPLYYDIIIIHEPESENEQAYPPLKVKVNENTTLINWVYHAAKAYADRETSYMDEEIEWLHSSGSSLDREIEEYQAIKNLLKKVLTLYPKGEYGSAMGGARICANRLNGLKTWLSNLKTLALFTSLGICLFAYGLASLLSSFVFEEPSGNKIRLISKVLIFALLMLTFSLTHPSLKIAYAIILRNMIGVTTPTIDLPASFLGCFIIGSVTYFLIALISIKKSSMTALALQLGVRSLRRRLPRTLLTLITITIVVSSGMIFVNMSMSRETRIKGSWKGTDTPGVLIQPDINLAPLSEYDVNWTRRQQWYKDSGYREEIAIVERLGYGNIVRRIHLLIGEQSLSTDVVGVDPIFMEKYYNFTNYVRGFWKEFSLGEPVAILSTSYEVLIGDYVTLAVKEFFIGAGPPTFLGERTLGSFRVVGKFDPSVLSKLTKLDSSPLFEDALNLVLVPIKAVKGSSMVISEVTILTKEGINPVDVAEELAYALGVATVANKDGLAVKIEWSLELSSSGLIPYLFPLTITGLMMYVTSTSVYEERKRESILLATLGLDPTNTFRVFIVGALLLGLMGTFLAFFGSYVIVIVLYYLTNLLGLYRIPTLSLSYANWSMPAILVALFTGVVMVFLGGYIPAVRAQGLSLMGRVKRRRLIGELISEGNITSFTLPIKETVQNGEMLYTYVRETIGKFKSSLVDAHSVKGEIRRDGSFTVSFVVLGPGQSVFVPCEVKGTRERESLVLTIEFPTSYKNYGQIGNILRDLEGYMIGFSAWKDMRLKMKIVRGAPKRQKTLEENLTEIKDIIAQIKDCNKKMKILEAQKGQISEEIHKEFWQKYTSIIEDKSKGLRSMAIGLEPHRNQLQGEIKKIEVEIERITIAYNLGEISEEEYLRTGGPLQSKLGMLKSKIKELEEIFEFIKEPLRII